MRSSSASLRKKATWIRVHKMRLFNSYNRIIRFFSHLTVAFLAALIFAGTFTLSPVYADEEDDAVDFFFSEDDEEEKEDPYAADDTGFTNYTGDVDIYTGKPVTDSDSRARSLSFVPIKDGSTYDSENAMFVYTLENGTFSCSVCDGMIVTNPVYLKQDGEFNSAVYCDGRKVDGIPDAVTEPGSYVVIYWDNVTENQILTFQIVEKETGRINQYIVPQGFTVRSVYLDGEIQKNSFGSVDLSKEGYYEITYTCSATGVEYYLNVTTDHTPPDVTFEGLDADNRARGPVTVRGLQEGDTIYVLRNDDEQGKINYQNQITQDGRYHVTVMDKAGNSVSKDFIIMIYLNVKGVVFLSLIIVIIIGVLIALYISRKRLRVR